MCTSRTNARTIAVPTTGEKLVNQATQNVRASCVVRATIFLRNVLLIHVVGWSSVFNLAHAQKKSSDYFEIPGGTFSRVKEGETVVKILFSGSPQWLVSQQDKLSHWHELAGLRSLAISHNIVSREEMEYVATLRSVNSLDISCGASEVEIVPGALTPLENMVWLKGLDVVADEGTTSEHWNFLSGLESLEWLSIRGTVNVPTVEHICRMKNLRELSLNGMVDVPNQLLSQIGRLSLLESAQLGTVANVTPVLRSLHGHQHLRHLSFKTLALDGADLAEIAGINGLEQLFLDGESMSLENLDRLNKLVELRLHFREFTNHGESALFKVPEKLKLLEILTPLSEKFSIAGLRDHQHLESLLLPNTELSLDDLDIVSSIKSLRYVTFANQRNSAWYQTAKKRLPNVVLAPK